MSWGCDRVLVATDGSRPSLAALDWAARIAEDIPAELVVVYAYDVDNDSGVPTETEAAAARKQIGVWCAEHGASGIDMRCTARPGDPRSVLRDAIGHEQPDLVVVGARGGGGFPGLLVGSVTDWLTQAATVPLAVVPDRGHRRTGGDILCGIDGSRPSERALEWAIGLAGRLRCAVHAVYGTHGPAGAGEPPFNHVEAVERVLARWRPNAATLHVPLELHVPPEHAVTALADRAAHDRAEAIVVGARGFGAFGEITIGRVPRQLLHVATRPVVIVPN